MIRGGVAVLAVGVVFLYSIDVKAEEEMQKAIVVEEEATTEEDSL